MRRKFDSLGNGTVRVLSVEELGRLIGPGRRETRAQMGNKRVRGSCGTKYKRPSHLSSHPGPEAEIGPVLPEGGLGA